MQLGSVMLDYFHPKLHLLIGGVLFVLSILASSYTEHFIHFIIFYAILGGFGYGIIYILPLKNAYAFYPHKKGMVGGIILASYSFAAIGWTLLSVSIVNPENDVPSLYLNVGSTTEILF
jgi:OFA family oxalate/formate antiporter-like MFS transporter